MMVDLKGKRVLVMGLGLHGGGLGVTRFLLRQGAKVTVTDLRGPEELAAPLQELAGEPVRYVLAGHRQEDFANADMVVRNPAVPNDSPYLEEARRHGVPIEMEMTLFFALCPGPILGVTGTKGKSTTTALLGEIMHQQHPDTVVAGNIRISALEALPQITAQTPVVLELSSWQLEGLGERGMSPHLAVVTNLSQDHMNRYPSWEAYVEAKKLICRAQGPGDLLVLNANDPAVRSFAREAPGQVAWFGVGLRRRGRALLATDRKLLPMLAGAALIARGKVIWVEPGGRATLICPVEQIALRGRHNQEDVLAATAAACLYGLPPQAIAAGIAAFRGLPDRLEVVRVLDGVTYVNDATSTAPASTVAALQAIAGPILLIAGGADKKLVFDEMAAAVAASTARAVLLLAGTATDRLEQALYAAGAGPRISGRFDNLAAAVQRARALARPGDTVLLSPGCASFGMFRHEFERGERFREIVRALPE
jgi:UDP-N-acetylmuramoylalanine--D-glutamate ligase